jgi:glycosyltransferase involved in cell wall biosynthesis
MRILIAAGIFPPDIGGPATYAKRLAEELALRGNEVSVLTYSDSEFQIANFKLQIFRVLRRKFKPVSYFAYFLAVLRYGRSADVIYVQDSVSAGFPVMLANAILRKRMVLKVVGDYAWERGGNANSPVLDEFYPFNLEKHPFRILVFRVIQTWTADVANAIIVPSEYLKKIVSRGWMIDEEKIHVVYNSISNYEVKFGIRDENVIVSAGRLVPWKGFCALIELMPELLKENPNFKLKIIGDGPEEEKLKKLVANVKSPTLHNSVIFTGRLAHEELLQELANAGMFVLNTGYEGLSHQLLESLYCKTPVITTNIGGNPEVIIDNENGLLVNYNDKDALKESILKLWRDESLRNKFRANGERILKEKFGFDFTRITNETLAVLDGFQEAVSKVLMISLDETILNPNSSAAERMREYGNICDDLKIVVLNTGRKEKIQLSEKVWAYPANASNKIGAIFAGFFIGWRIARDFKSSIITTQDPFRTGLIGWILSKIMGIGFNVQIHGDFYGSYWNKNIFGKIKNIFGGFIIKRADSVRTVSASIADSLGRLKLLEESVVVPILTDIEKIKNAIPKFSLRDKFPGKKIILSVGRLEKEKNHIFLLRMMKELLKDMPEAFLVIVGDGSLRKYLKEQAKELGVDKSVWFAGWQDDLVPFYKTCDFYALPSLTESFGATILEASAAGVPVLMTSQVGLAKEYLENDKSVVIRENEKDFALSIFNFQNNTTSRENVIAAAEDAFKKVYSKENILSFVKLSWILADRKNKILIITQKVDKNDPILGFFHNWLLEFAESVGQIYVIANEVGEYDLPANVKVFSLGKENGVPKLARYARFINLSRKLVPRCGGIFAHMCPEYVIAVSPIAKIHRKKILLWFVHKSKNAKLALAEKLSNGIFTVAKESCALESKKIHIVGHGIDTDDFKLQISNFKLQNNELFKILSVGRISPIKDYKTLIEALDILVKKDIKSVKITIVGEAYLESDRAYKAELLKLIDERGLKEYVQMLGAKTQNELIPLYNSHNLHINLCPTGGVDKVVLEAGACELPSLVANEAFVGFLGKDLIFKHGDAIDLAEKIELAQKMDLQAIGKVLREKVIAEHNLKNLIKKIYSFYGND